MYRKGFQIISFGKDYAEKYQRYEDHLKKIDRRRNPDLWRYFRKSYFHDGTIRDLKFTGNLDRLSFIVPCVNIRHKSEKLFQKHGVCEMDFIVTVREISHFQIDIEECDRDATFPPCPELYFHECEINTLVDAVGPNQNEEESPSSLIISINGQEKYISMIFGMINVMPLEVTAFYQMLTSGQFIIPMFNDEVE